MKAVIMAGGKGTRVASIARDIPKPMLSLLGKPILQWQIEALVREGFADIILVIGHLGHVIRDCFGDGAALGASITYLEEKEPLGTAGALALLKNELADDDFLLLNGDLLFDVDLARFLAYHRACGGAVTVLAHPSTHLFDSTALKTENGGRVTAFLPPDKTASDRPNLTNAGLHFCSPLLLDRFTEVKKTDLDREVLAPLAGEGLLFAYRTPEYVKDLGTPERLAAGERDLVSGLVAKGNLKKPQRAVFLDRDGTVNRHVGFVTSPDQLELLPRAAEAIALLNARHIPVILITNQPVVARGEVSEEELLKIHDRLGTLLAKKSAYLDDIFYCPHHPDSGFAGEVAALKRVCNCRKPAPGLLLAAAKKYHIDPAASFMIGDSARDVQAGKRAGCRTAAIGNIDGADICGTDLFDCVTQILANEDKTI